MQTDKLIKIFSCLSLVTFVAGGCKKFVDTDPPSTSITGENVFSSDATAASVLTGLYNEMSGQGPLFGITGISVYCGLSSDEIRLWEGSTSENLIAYYQNALTSNTNFTFWSRLYPAIFVCNSAIAGLEKTTTLTPAVREQLLGEAKFLRAFYYFYLTNLYKNVPLVTGTNYKENALLPNADQALIYEQIIADLISAKALLNDQYVQGDGLNAYPQESVERVRPNKAAASALLARVYLFTGDYVAAEKEASTVIDNNLYALSPIAEVFNRNSTEAIWQLQPVNYGWNTDDGKLFIIPEGGLSDFGNPVYLDKSVVSAMETDDLRRINWVDSIDLNGNIFYYPFKYKNASYEAPVTEYLMVLRVVEQYLIRAEARAQQGNITGAASDLDAVRARAGLPPTTASEQNDLVSAIQQERRVELFSEWGHRWLDLKRSGNIDAVMTTATAEKGGSWNTNWQWYPIPLAEIQRAPQLEQNEGY